MDAKLAVIAFVVCIGLIAGAFALINLDTNDYPPAMKTASCSATGCSAGTGTCGCGSASCVATNSGTCGCRR